MRVAPFVTPMVLPQHDITLERQMRLSIGIIRSYARRPKLWGLIERKDDPRLVELADELEKLYAVL